MTHPELSGITRELPTPGQWMVARDLNAGTWVVESLHGFDRLLVANCGATDNPHSRANAYILSRAADMLNVLRHLRANPTLLRDAEYRSQIARLIDETAPI